MLQPLGTKQVKPKAFAEAGVYILELALSLTKPFKMKSAALIFCAMAITIQPEILQKVLVKPGLSQKTIVVTNKLKVSLTSYRFSYFYNSIVLFFLLKCLWIGVDFKIQTLIPHRIPFNVVNRRIILQVDGFHGTVRNIPIP